MKIKNILWDFVLCSLKMGCLKLSYYEQERALEVNPIFHLQVVEKNGIAEKNRVSSSTYGFNGKEKDLTASLGTNNYDYGFRIYNPQIAKFLSVDPLTKDYPWYTPYQFAGNMPIAAIDLDGAEPEIVTYKNGFLMITGGGGGIFLSTEEDVQKEVNRYNDLLRKYKIKLDKKSGVHVFNGSLDITSMAEYKLYRADETRATELLKAGGKFKKYYENNNYEAPTPIEPYRFDPELHKRIVNQIVYEAKKKELEFYESMGSGVGTAGAVIEGASFLILALPVPGARPAAGIVFGVGRGTTALGLTIETAAQVAQEKYGEAAVNVGVTFVFGSIGDKVNDVIKTKKILNAASQGGVRATEHQTKKQLKKE